MNIHDRFGTSSMALDWWCYGLMHPESSKIDCIKYSKRKQFSYHTYFINKGKFWENVHAMVYHCNHKSFIIFVTFLFLAVSLSSFVSKNTKGLLEIDFVNNSRRSARPGINDTILETGFVDTSSPHQSPKPQKYVNLLIALEQNATNLLILYNVWQ